MLSEYPAGASLAVKPTHGSVNAELFAGVSYVCDTSTQNDRILFEICNDAFGSFRLLLLRKEVEPEGRR